jgi:hypothetical protein
MRFSRLDLLILVAGLAGTGACQGDRPAAEPAEQIESAAVPTVPAESTASEPTPAPAAAAPTPVAQSENRRR